MTKRIKEVPPVSKVPSVPKVPPVSKVPEAGPMETAVLKMMAGFGEIIYKVGEKIVAVFKKKKE